ncbi:unnamed protein product [marine sediment metagenome]|uniref:Uncharacterized protein n=1 Tax=marine sediment metagenome TaxID=412755 RepID=X0Z0M7_9ZZZZ
MTNIVVNKELEKSLLEKELTANVEEQQLIRYLQTLWRNKDKIAPPREVGFFRQKWFCPKCNERLFPKEYILTLMVVMQGSYTYFKCECGYERAE